MQPAEPHTSHPVPPGSTPVACRVARRVSARTGWLCSLALLACLCGSLQVVAGPTPFRILVVLSEEGPQYLRVVDALRMHLETLCTPDCNAPLKLETVAEAKFEPAKAADFNLLLPLGRAASMTVARRATRTRTIYALIPEGVWTEIQECCPPPLQDSSALFLDQPIGRHLRLIRLALPQLARVGLLVGPSSESVVSDAETAAHATGQTLVTRAVAAETEVGPQLRDLIKDADVLLAVPDPLIYNRSSIVAILLTTYSERVPLVGYSQAMVNAGAVLALYSTPEDVGWELADRVGAVLSGQPLPPSSPLRHFQVGVNREVARSLGLDIAPDEVLVRQLGGHTP